MKVILKTHDFHTKMLSEANVKINRMVSTKCTYHKNYFNFLKKFSVYGPLINSSFDVLTTQMPIFLLFVSAAILFDSVFFPVSILNCFFISQKLHHLKFDTFMRLLSDLIYIWVFFSIWVFFHKHSQITGLQGKVECISLTPHYHFHLLHRH